MRQLNPAVADSIARDSSGISDAECDTHVARQWHSVLMYLCRGCRFFPPAETQNTPNATGLRSVETRALDDAFSPMDRTNGPLYPRIRAIERRTAAGPTRGSAESKGGRPSAVAVSDSQREARILALDARRLDAQAPGRSHLIAEMKNAPASDQRVSVILDFPSARAAKLQSGKTLRGRYMSHAATARKIERSAYHESTAEIVIRELNCAGACFLRAADAFDAADKMTAPPGDAKHFGRHAAITGLRTLQKVFSDDDSLGTLTDVALPSELHTAIEDTAQAVGCCGKLLPYSNELIAESLRELAESDLDRAVADLRGLCESSVSALCELR